MSLRKVAMDSIDLTIDDAWLDPLQAGSFSQCFHELMSQYRGLGFRDLGCRVYP